MQSLLGENWENVYPSALTKAEKINIHSALLKNLQNGSNPFRDLKSYL